jgi:RYK receptor-like tyrosine kinase
LIPGLNKELYYVREGVLNSYALQFTVPVPAHVDAIHFTWQTLGQKPVRKRRVSNENDSSEG